MRDIVKAPAPKGATLEVADPWAGCGVPLPHGQKPCACGDRIACARGENSRLDGRRREASHRRAGGATSIMRILSVTCAQQIHPGAVAVSLLWESGRIAPHDIPSFAPTRSAHCAPARRSRGRMVHGSSARSWRHRRSRFARARVHPAARRGPSGLRRSGAPRFAPALIRPDIAPYSYSRLAKFVWTARCASAHDGRQRRQPTIG
jgi:hypothetical protein